MQKELKTRQICLFFIAFLPLSKIFTLPSIIAKQAVEDMWLSSLLNFIIDGVVLVLLIVAMRKSNLTVYQLLEKYLGKLGSKILLFLYVIYFNIKALLPINEQKDYVQFTLYTLMPTLAYFLPFFIVAFYLSIKRLRAIGRISDILWFITLSGFFLLFSLSFANADFSAILPVGARGIKNIVKGSYFSLPWFGDSLYLLFFIGEFAYKKRDGIKIALSYLLGMLCVILFMIIFYCIFTSIAFRQRFALTEISKYTTVINNTGRLDYLGILLLLLSNLFALSLPIFFSVKLLVYVFNVKRQWIVSLIVVGLHFLISVFLSEFFFSIEHLSTTVLGVYYLLLGNILPIIFACLFIKENNREHQKS